MFRVGMLLVAWLMCRSVLAQADIHGHIVNEEGALPFAHIVPEASGTGAISDGDGNFRLTGLSEGSIALRVTAIGHTPVVLTVKVPPAGSTDLGTIRLQRTSAELDEVVITGTMREMSRSASPVPVEVITPQLFRRNPESSLLGSIGMVNGVRPQLNCSVCNTGDIHINGMEGPYTLVLIDGMPIVSGLSTVYGLSGIPTGLVERVEVVKGPGSALYGSEAMGGVINVITKDPTLAPLASAEVMSSSWMEHNADLGFRSGTGKLRGLTGVNMFHYDLPQDRNNDGFTDLTLQKRLSVFQKFTLLRPKRRIASLAARYVYEDRWGGEMEWTPAFAGGDSIYGESISTRRTELIGQYQLPFTERVMAQISWNRHDQSSWYGTTPYDAVQQVFFGQLYWSHRYALRHEVLAGLAYRHTFYNDNSPATSIGEEPDAKDRPQRKPLPGLFIQDEWAVSDLHTLLLGYRLDNDVDHGMVHSPRFAWKYAPNGRYTVRASLGTGYRVVNLFTEDHAALTGAREVVIAEDLLPERSWNATVNMVRRWYGTGRSLSLDGTIFHTRFSNRILPDYTTDPTQIRYTNLDGRGIAQGASLNVEVRSGESLRILAGASWMQVYTDEAGEREQQFFAPAWSGTFTAAYDLPSGTTLDLTAQWYGPMRLPILPNDFRPEFSPWYALVNVQVEQRLNDRFELFGGVKNLLDFVPDDPLMRPWDPFDRTVDDAASNPNGYTFDTSYMYAPLQGIRAFLGIRWVLP